MCKINYGMIRGRIESGEREALSWNWEKKSQEIKEKGAGYVLPCYWWVNSAWWLQSVLHGHEILFPAILSIPNSSLSPRELPGDWDERSGCQHLENTEVQRLLIEQEGGHSPDAGEIHSDNVYFNSSLQFWSARGEERIEPSLVMFLWVLSVFVGMLTEKKILSALICVSGHVWSLSCLCVCVSN